MPNALLEPRTAVRPFAGIIGAEVDCGIVQQLDDATFAELHRACLDHLVVLIRGQSLSIPDLLAFGRRFGELSPAAPVHKGQKPREYPELAVISNVVENGVAIGGLGDGEAVWHSDSCFNDIPPSFSILHSLEIPPAGGDTGFSNMYAALETLPPELLRAVRGKTIKHDLRYTSGGQLRPGYTGQEDIRTTPGPRHPVIRRHPDTGCDALYLGRRPYAVITEVSAGESEALLDALWAHAAGPTLSWHHQWRVGDILIWDNRCVMHRRDAFDPASRRIMHRTQCMGTLPIEGDGETAARHPRSH
ncbi:MAG: TauD/TfdA dioxygenase family protein [Burkholderiales bacterium]|jgi:taurine dioxygenase